MGACGGLLVGDDIDVNCRATKTWNFRELPIELKKNRPLYECVYSTLITHRGHTHCRHHLATPERTRVARPQGIGHRSRRAPRARHTSRLTAPSRRTLVTSCAHPAVGARARRVQHARPRTARARETTRAARAVARVRTRDPVTRRRSHSSRERHRLVTASGETATRARSAAPATDDGARRGSCCRRGAMSRTRAVLDAAARHGRRRASCIRQARRRPSRLGSARRGDAGSIGSATTKTPRPARSLRKMEHGAQHPLAASACVRAASGGAVSSGEDVGGRVPVERPLPDGMQTPLATICHAAHRHDVRGDLNSTPRASTPRALTARPHRRMEWRRPDRPPSRSRSRWWWCSSRASDWRLPRASIRPPHGVTQTVAARSRP